MGSGSLDPLKAAVNSLSAPSNERILPQTMLSADYSIFSQHENRGFRNGGEVQEEVHGVRKGVAFFRKVDVVCRCVPMPAFLFSLRAVPAWKMSSVPGSTEYDDTLTNRTTLQCLSSLTWF